MFREGEVLREREREYDRTVLLKYLTVVFKKLKSNTRLGTQKVSYMVGQVTLYRWYFKQKPGTYEQLSEHRFILGIDIIWRCLLFTIYRGNSRVEVLVVAEAFLLHSLRI